MYRCRASRATPRICTISTPTATTIVGRFSTLADPYLRNRPVTGLSRRVSRMQPERSRRLRLGQRRSLQYTRHLRRRYRPHQCERLFDGADGLPHPEHRSHYQGRHDVHRLLCRAELHCRPFDLHYRASTGLSKVGVPGSPVGLQDRDITIAQALKPLGYATG